MLLVPQLHTIIVNYTSQWFDFFDFANTIQSQMMLSGKGQAPDDTSFVRLKMVEINHSKAKFFNMETLS